MVDTGLEHLGQDGAVGSECLRGLGIWKWMERDAIKPSTYLRLASKRCRYRKAILQI